ncbi:MAG: alpha/beta fold hydrolase [Woeseiaceae bacterium]|nr:alpha/beta fold hydrolase [Woeseiaceae bacterium]
MEISRKLLLLVLVAGLLAGCATTIRSDTVQHYRSSECVVLLHGLNRSWRTMDKMAASLQQDGFSTANVDYPSSTMRIEELAPLVVNEGLRQCRQTGATTVHFVTHSMGGILVRYVQAQEPIPDLGRVVMLGPPNQGSEVIDVTRDWPGIEMISGESGLQLGTDEESIPSQLGPVDFELGIIAGTGTTNPFMSALMLPDEDDGKVTVARTRVEGMDDFTVVPDSHFAMMKSDSVIAATSRFLRTGSFEAEDLSD